MSRETRENRVIKICEHLSSLYYLSCLKHTIKSCPKYLEDPWDSIRFFLKGFAFERQGKSPDYSPAAYDLLEEYVGKQKPTITNNRNDAKEIWKRFADMFGNKNLNPKNNPLCPNELCNNKSKSGNTEEKRVSRKSVIEFVADNLKGRCLVPWARDLLKSKPEEVHKSIIEIRGVGDKIASFFLRDVACIFGIELTKNREILQPIDTWIRFVAQDLADNPKLTDKKCAKYIVEHSREPEKANQGIWYYCTHVANSSRYVVKKSIRDPELILMKQLINDHIDNLKSIGEKATKLASEF